MIHLPIVRVATFGHEKAQLLTIVQAAWQARTDAAWKPHPLFGKMTTRQWGKLLQMHLDYHLRQFRATMNAVLLGFGMPATSILPMLNPDFLLYAVHGAFWASFGLTQVLLRGREPREEPKAVGERTAPYSRALLWLHSMAFGVMYWGMGMTIIPHRVPAWFPGQRIVGTMVIAAGAALMSWARVWFTSWRFRAKLDAGHQLATGGPFALLRHPIYMGLNLLAIGTAIWDPTLATWIAAILMVIGSDLRGRAEERVLTEVFGPVYVTYMGKTSRFVPGVY